MKLCQTDLFITTDKYVIIIKKLKKKKNQKQIKEFEKISTKFDNMVKNDNNLQTSQNQTDSQIKTNTKNKYKTLQVTEILNSVGKLEQTFGQFNTKTTIDICKRIADVITLPSLISSLFKYIHTSFRQVKSASMMPCRETNNYWSNPSGYFLPYPMPPVKMGF